MAGVSFIKFFGSLVLTIIGWLFVFIGGFTLTIQSNAKLLILHVLESPDPGQYRLFVKDFKTGRKFLSTEYKETVREQIDNQCARALKPYGNYEIKATIGLPWEEILRWARKERVDLIVLGPHAGRAGEKGVVRLSGMIGSTAEGVIMHARCPVMIVNRKFKTKTGKTV